MINLKSNVKNDQILIKNKIHVDVLCFFDKQLPAEFMNGR